MIGLILITKANPAGQEWRDLEFQPLARFFLNPFCVSNFSAVMSKEGTEFILPHNRADTLVVAGAVAGFQMPGATVADGVRSLTRNMKPTAPGRSRRSD